MKIQKKSILDGSINTLDLDVTLEQLHQYQEHKMLVQDIFPKLDKGEREFLISGILPEQWKETFPDE